MYPLQYFNSWNMDLKVRKPAVAGQFYSSNTQALRKEVMSMMDASSTVEIGGELKMLIVPHAGYMYSGPVAAHAYAILRDQAMRKKFRKVILIGPAHTMVVSGCVADESDFWRTPLGDVPVTKNTIRKMAAPHRREHCLEVQLPFLQCVLEDFEITPILVGDLHDFGTITGQITDLLDANTVLLISSDLSHFYPYEQAILLDGQTISAIENFDIQVLMQNGIACGKKPIRIGLEIAIGNGWKCQLLKYMNSGDVSNDRSSVVGYAGFALFSSDINGRK